MSTRGSSTGGSRRDTSSAAGICASTTARTDASTIGNRLPELRVRHGVRRCGTDREVVPNRTSNALAAAGRNRKWSYRGGGPA